MSLPKITIIISGGNLGGLLATGDNIVGAALACEALAPSGMTLGEAKRYKSLTAIVADGLDAAYNATAYRQMKEIYDIRGNAEVWIMPVPNTVVMEDICDKANSVPYLLNLIKQSNYAVKVVGICRVPDVGYAATYVAGLDDDVKAAAIKAQSLCKDLEALGIPVVVLIEGRDYQGDPDDLLDLKTCDYNYVGIPICGTSDTDKSASIGLILGKCAEDPVQRSPGRVKSGALPIGAAYTSDGEVINEDDIESIHDKGYITIRNFRGRSGFYFSAGPLAAADTDDFNSIMRRRVINKAVRIAYDTYTNEINDEIRKVAGKIDPAVAKAFQGVLQTQIDGLMTSEGNITRAEIFVEPEPSGNNKIEITLTLGVIDIAEDIQVTIGFANL